MQGGGVNFAQDAAARGLGTPDAAVDALMLTDVSNMDFHTFRRVVQDQQERDLPAPPRAVLRCIPEVMDDFIRNFLLRNGMHRTLEQFEAEWYEKYGAGASHNTPLVPDNYLETAALLNRIEVLEHDLRQHAELTTKATKQWVQAKKDRDFHRANHNRVVQEKNKLQRLLKQAHDHAEDINPTVVELRQRCEGLFKAKSLVAMERDRLEQSVAQLEGRVQELLQQIQQLQPGEGPDAEAATSAAGKKPGKPSTLKKKGAVGAVAGSRAAAAAAAGGRRGEAAAAASPAADADGGSAAPFVWPQDERPPATATCLPPHSDPSTWSNQASFLAHSMPVTKVAMHPRKPAVASCSDDGTWRLSTLPQGDVIVSGEGHRNWVSCIAMHPRGTMVATGAGDKTVKLWDFASNSCANTLSAHTDGVWSLDFQETGALLASGALDQTARVWDVELGKCRQTLRGHVEAVNSVCWKPYTNILCTGSGDKTVSLWDTRINCCAQTLYGHRSAVMSVATVASGSIVASCDSEGVVVLWDVRRMEQRMTIACGPYPANHVCIDPSGSYVAVASDDTTIKVVDIKEEVVSELTGHEDAVQCVVFDPATNNFLVSCSSDRTVRYWS